MHTLRTFYKTLLLFFILTTTAEFAQAQMPDRSHVGEIYQRIQKLDFLGSAMYVAAHPDDENQRIIAYLANHKHARTAYLSLTRGDGGQNLVGAEIRELLGVIRTQELLAARRIDGGTQLFSRANDFGYSKSPKETLEIWEQDEVLADVVWAIRRWRPDVIVNRFLHEVGRRSTHGHHTSSAILSVEAFDKAADPELFPEQLQLVEPWQPRRIFFNTSWWFYGSREKFDAADKSRMMSVDIGTYYPMLGESNNEISARARSQHKSQGFGDMGVRGSQQEYLQLIKGDMPTKKADLFEGINTSWTRVKGGAPIGKLVDKLKDEYDFQNPAASVPLLIEIYDAINKLADSEAFWRDIKLEETKSLIADCLGLFLEVTAEQAYTAPGASVELNIEAINRSMATIIIGNGGSNMPQYTAPVSLLGLSLSGATYDTTFYQTLEYNTRYAFNCTVRIPKERSYSSPYWLNEEGSLGMYAVPDQEMRGQPETAPPLQLAFTLSVYGHNLIYNRPVVYKYEDPVKGEVYEPFHLLPPVFVSFEQKNHIITGTEAFPVVVSVLAGQDDIGGEVQLDLPSNWRIEPASQNVSLAKRGQSQQFTFMVRPPAGQSKVNCQAAVSMGGKTYDRSLVQVDYVHIPKQSVLLPAQAQLAKLDIRIGDERIGYIMGAGDEVPEGLRQIGYSVDLIGVDEISASRLAAFETIILGIRAYNTQQQLALQQPLLMDFVKKGGTLIVQYNTAHRLKLPMDELGPYPLKLSRKRVTQEDAPIQILQPNHPALTSPNRITTADFEGWVQERGLYFPEEWDEAYTPLLSSHDSGEEELRGGLLVASYGEGHYVYSGYSWFRQLPAGVPGAYRLLANLIAL